MHKKNCRQFALHLKLIGNLLEQLKISELKKYPETREPLEALEQLEDALRRSYILVNSCQDRSYLYLLAMGWNIVYQFRKAQGEIDRYLRLVPLIILVDNARFKERLEDIERDQREYTLDEDDQRVQDVILKPDPSKNDTLVLKKTLSCSYPNLAFDKALQKENEKLQLELQRSQAHLDVGQCQVIQRLIDVTESAQHSLPEKSSPLKGSKKMERNHSDVSNDKEHSYSESYHKQSDTHMQPSRNTSSVSSGRDLLSTRGSHQNEEWHSDLLDCCAEPSLFELLGIKSYLPAYLDPLVNPNKLLTGVSFASGGVGYDPLSAKLATAFGLEAQLEMFKEYMEKVKAIGGEEKAKSILSESLFLIVCGSNDISNTYFTSPLRKLHYDVPAYTDLMVQGASSFLQELYGLGPRRFGIFSAPPIGCVPSQRTLAGGKQRACAADYNHAAQLFNSKLSSEIDNLNRKLPHSKFLYIDIYNPLYDVINNPDRYGFKEASKGCCGTGMLETTVLCNEFNPFTCKDASKYVFWDGFHPTEKTYQQLVGLLLNKYINSTTFCPTSGC